MRITKRTLRKMVIQEMRNLQRQKRLQEGTAERPIKLTAETLNRIIREEYSRFNRRQRLAEARRRRARR
tara:strand:+ start:457 stop:663 length:207 start_codon:yes stop_codon:yes gene_type:complete